MTREETYYLKINILRTDIKIYQMLILKKWSFTFDLNKIFIINEKNSF